MHYRLLGKTGITVSELGFGAWGIGGSSKETPSYGKTDDRESVEALKRAFDLGVTCYDTSPAYGDGHSEELIGKAFRTNRKNIMIASKVGFTSFRKAQDFSPEGIRASMEQSLRRLQTDYLDLLQLHNPGIHELAENPNVVGALVTLKKEGKILAWGISVKSPDDGLAAIRELHTSVLQVNFNLIDQRARENGLLELAAAEGVGIIVRTPFNFGFLTGKYGDTKFGALDHRSRWPAEQLKRWAEAPALFSEVASENRRTLPELALKFCLAPESVATVIPGMLTVSEVEENIRVADSGPLQEEELAAIRAIYASHKFFV